MISHSKENGLEIAFVVYYIDESHHLSGLVHNLSPTNLLLNGVVV